MVALVLGNALLPGRGDWTDRVDWRDVAKAAGFRAEVTENVNELLRWLQRVEDAITSLYFHHVVVVLDKVALALALEVPTDAFAAGIIIVADPHTTD
jgi:hypothetical protein